MNTLEGTDQWPNTALPPNEVRILNEHLVEITTFHASIPHPRCDVTDNTAALPEPESAFVATIGDVRKMNILYSSVSADLIEQARVKLLELVMRGQKPSTLPPSSPATPSEDQERVETAEEAFDAWWTKSDSQCNLQGIGHLNKIDCQIGFRAGYEAGRKAK